MAAESLQAYLYKTRRLLHDAKGGFYSDNDIVQYVLEARGRVARDSGCLRMLTTSLTLTEAVESYDVDDLIRGTTSGEAPPAGHAYAGLASIQDADIIDLLGCTLYWGNQRIKMAALPWSTLDARFRAMQTFQSRPVAFSRLNQNTVYFEPVPDQAYTIDCEIIVAPTNDPSNWGTTTSVLLPPNLNEPFQSPVPYYAAYLAKQYEQSYGEALQVYLQQYQQALLRAMGQWNRFSHARPYA